MCEARVILRNGSDEREIMQDVVSVTPSEGGLKITNILGETLTVQAKVTEVQMLHPHTVVLQGDQ